MQSQNASAAPVLLRDRMIDDRGAKYGKAIIERDFQMADGRVFPILCVSSAGIVPVVIIALTTRNTIILVNQFRFAINSWIIELPGGCPKPGQNVLDAAKMELLEEAGVRATSLEILEGTMPFNPALEDNQAIAIIARDCEVVSSQTLDETEVANLKEVTIPEFRDMVKKGEIVDCKTIAIAYRALDRLGLL